MEPQRPSQATLVDLLDRLLDRGLVLSADIVISVAGVPLIGINLRAAVASVETMMRYGMFQDWDARIGAQGPSGEPWQPAPCLAAEARRDGGC